MGQECNAADFNTVIDFENIHIAFISKKFQKRRNYAKEKHQ